MIKSGSMSLVYNPDYAVPAGWALEERLDAMRLPIAAFAEQCDLPLSVVEGILDGEVAIDDSIASAFERVLGVDAAIWLGIDRECRQRRVTS